MPNLWLTLLKNSHFNYLFNLISAILLCFDQSARDIVETRLSPFVERTLPNPFGSFGPKAPAYRGFHCRSHLNKGALMPSGQLESETESEFRPHQAH